MAHPELSKVCSSLLIVTVNAVSNPFAICRTIRFHPRERVHPAQRTCRALSKFRARRAYSYVLFSSPRQVALTLAYCKRKGLALDDSLNLQGAPPFRDLEAFPTSSEEFP